MRLLSYEDSDEISLREQYERLENSIDLDKIIEKYLNDAQKRIVLAELAGMTFNDIGVTKKFWRYHRDNAHEIIKQHLGDK